MENEAIPRLWLAVGLGCLVAPLLCGIALRSLFAPISALRRACEQVPEWGTMRALDPQRSDELGLLCTAFDRMRAKLEESHRSGQRYNEELERTVSRKTRQLAAMVERLRSLDQMKDAFLACVSNELQSPVRSILATCNELAGPAGPEPRAERLRRILSDCRHVDQMTQDILDLVRASSDRFDYRFEPTTIEGVLQRALASVRERMTRNDVVVELFHVEDCPVTWDASKMCRVVEAIVLHAMQKAPSGGTVFVESRIESRMTAQDVRIEIRVDTPVPERPVTDVSEHGRIGRTLWTRVLEQHSGAWREQESDHEMKIVVSLPAAAGHPAAAVASDASEPSDPALPAPAEAEAVG